ncbi:nicotinate-nucleotide--dimethylbenzimidazole phosphoribosyltransferase [Hydrogenophaga sp. 5NK40-0174]|uniref:nicotinate-nucleotide--dimethylbenzimidazole phosphoribosyltransferase n=1 Tax=Hydrogenophaga sp. 5NK40-0174 TaxID=3127649 RepID=UPI0031062209
MTTATERSASQHTPPPVAVTMALPEIEPTGDAQLDHTLAGMLSKPYQPRRALGRIESLASQLARIQQQGETGFGSLSFQFPQAVVFASDHGVADEGVADLPQSATLETVRALLDGEAHTNRLAVQHGFGLTVVDAGVATHVTPGQDSPVSAQLMQRKIGYGTRNMLLSPAMSGAQAVSAVNAGMDVVKHLPGNVLAIGSTGVAGHASASVLLSRLCGVPLVDALGQDGDLDETKQQSRSEKLFAALTRHRKATSPMDALASLGGFEIAMMTGAMLQAASERRIILVDGFVAGAAALVARGMSPNVDDYLVHTHRSHHAGHRLLLIHMQAQPLLDLDIRAGEAVGALTAWPLLQSVQTLLSEVPGQTIPEVQLP